MHSSSICRNPYNNREKNIAMMWPLAVIWCTKTTAQLLSESCISLHSNASVELLGCWLTKLSTESPSFLNLSNFLQCRHKVLVSWHTSLFVQPRSEHPSCKSPWLSFSRITKECGIQLQSQAVSTRSFNFGGLRIKLGLRTRKFHYIWASTL